MNKLAKERSTDIVKRVILYLVGLFILSIGVGISIASDLGVSPVSALPYVLSQVTSVDLGICTSLVFCILIFLQICILRRDFKIYNVLQIAVSFLFGIFVNFSTKLMAFLAISDFYLYRLLLVFIAIVVVGIGVWMYTSSKIIPLPTEGLMLAISLKFKKKFSSVKICFDITIVAIAVIISLVVFKKLVGVREGTILAAILVGFIVKILNHFFARRIDAIDTSS